MNSPLLTNCSNGLIIQSPKLRPKDLWASAISKKITLKSSRSDCDPKGIPFPAYQKTFFRFECSKIRLDLT